MNARIASRESPPSARIDAKFIEEHRLLDLYLENALPAKGARDLEDWCRAHPGYLDALKLQDRAQASLKLLEACGSAPDLREAKTPWWKTPYVSIGLITVALASLTALWAVGGKYSLARSELSDARTQLRQGSMIQPAKSTTLHVTPDRSSGADHARIDVAAGAGQLIDLHIDLNHLKATQFRMVVDKKDQGRALVLNNLLKDSNGELRLTFNSSGLASGAYGARIEALPSRGDDAPTAVGWISLNVH